ncbi:hypothetical protein TorRG33x02_216380, partial [Trema orientale]
MLKGVIKTVKWSFNLSWLVRGLHVVGRESVEKSVRGRARESADGVGLQVGSNLL